MSAKLIYCCLFPEPITQAVNDLYYDNTPLAKTFRDVLDKSCVYALKNYDLDFMKSILAHLDVSGVSGDTRTEKIFLRLYKNFQNKGEKVCIFLLVYAYINGVHYVCDGKQYSLSHIVSCDSPDNYD